MQFILLIVCIVAFVDCKMKVLRPPDLVDHLGSKVNIALANFGQIPFGHRLMGYVDMAQPNDGCSPLQSATGSQFIMIERGNCTFVTKVRNAQNAGYSLAIIGNNNDEPLQSDFVMADDGQGYSVNIPSIFISLRDFNIMKEYASNYKVLDNSDDKIFILVKFDVEKKDQIDVIFSLDVNDRDSYRVVDEYSQYYNLLQNENINYTLVYQIFNSNNTELDYIIDEDNCICSRRYCSIDPDGEGIASGRNVVEEAIRQTCIFKLFPDKYFQYMNQFNFQCTKAQAYSTCGSKIITNLQLSANEITKCRDESFKDPLNDQTTKNLSNAYNAILEHQLIVREQAGMVGLPSVVVNSIVYKGQLTGKGVFGEICNSFIIPPLVCKSEVENFYQFEHQSQHYLFLVILLVSILIAIFIIVLFFLFKKFVQRDSVEVTQVQVNEMVSQYIKFYEGKDQQKQNSF
ncbi:unnamed protein product [Paramecium pentaurelia]|uniref:PA domain-containing protein n=1 Tax=Paramecium pentaurelia TaxID=43138 RepID=A0A8S1WZA6_9CILI|nr:unnamed protein product [Paramecium pentaurelia]